MTRIIDFHTHFEELEASARGGSHNVLSGFGARPRERALPSDGRRYQLQQGLLEPSVHLSEMDRLGIDVHVISLTGVICNTDWADPSESAALNRRTNEWCAEWVRGAPHRFVGTCTLPLQDTPASIRELEYAIDTLRLTGVSLSSNCRGTYIGEEPFLPLWEAIHAKAVPVFIHPHGMNDPKLQRYFLWNGIGQPMEETRAMASLIFEGVLDRFPGLKIIMAHGGGYFPHYTGRLDRNFQNNPASRVHLSKPPSEYLRDFYYDSCVYSPQVLEALATRVGADRIVFGSDYPVGELDPLAVLKACSTFTESDRQMILDSTPATILGIC